MQSFEYCTPTRLIFGKGVIEKLPGIQPNPKYDPSVLDGVRLCKEHRVDVILSVGGGSVNPQSFPDLFRMLDDIIGKLSIKE